LFDFFGGVAASSEVQNAAFSRSIEEELRERAAAYQPHGEERPAIVQGAEVMHGRDALITSPARRDITPT
jgi:hypothetical protein